MLRMLPLLATLLSAPGTADPVTNPGPSQLDAALNEVRMEEKVFDAFWQDVAPPILVVRLFDDGSQRHGYAGYLCMLLAEHGLDEATVRLVDVASREERDLARVRCKQLGRGGAR